MKKLLVPALALLLGGCSYFSIFESEPSYEEKQQFLAELNKENLSQRDRCRRIYAFSKSWARSMGECSSIIDSLETLEKAMDEGTVKIVPATQP
jgi:hypothetical protein